MQANPIFLAALESAFEQVLKLSPATRDSFARLTDKAVHLHITGLETDIYIVPHPQGVSLSGRYEDEPDATVRAAPFSLLRMLIEHDNGLLNSGDIKVDGDMRTVQQLLHALHTLKIDWDMLFQEKNGNANRAWRNFGYFLTSGITWGRQNLEILEQSIGEYLRAEAGLLPTEEEVQRFVDDTDTLRAAADRLEQRIKRLEPKL